MNSHIPSISKVILAALLAVIISTIELFLLGIDITIPGYSDWQELEKPPSEAVMVVEVGYIRSRDGNIYKNSTMLDYDEGWTNVWIKVERIESNYSTNSDNTTCEVPNISNVKSIIIRCEILDNYSKTHAMAIRSNGNIYEYSHASNLYYSALARWIISTILIEVNIIALLFVIIIVLQKIHNNQE